MSPDDDRAGHTLDLLGSPVHDCEGKPLGEVRSLYLDRHTQEVGR